MYEETQNQNNSQNLSITIDLIEHQKKNQKSQTQRNKRSTKIQSQFDEIYYKNISNSTMDKQEAQKALQKRIKKFHTYGKKLQIQDHYFCPRIQPTYKLFKKQKPQGQIAEEQQIYPVQDQIILYGIDFMKIKTLRQTYKPRQYISVDSSHVRFKYDSYQEALDILIKNQRENVFQNQIKLEAGKKRDIPRKWIQMKPYYVDQQQRRLIVRFITNYQRQNLKSDIIASQKRNKEIHQIARQAHQKKKRQKEQIQRRHDERRNKRYFQYQDEDGNKYQNISFDEKRQRSRQKSRIFNDGQGKFAKTLLRPQNQQANLSQISYRIEVKQNQDDRQNSMSDLSFILKDNIGYRPDAEDQQLTPGQLINKMNNLQIQNSQNGQKEFPGLQFDFQPRNRGKNKQQNSLSQSNRSINLSYSLSQNMPGPEPSRSQNTGIIKKWNYKDYLQETQNQQKKKKIDYIQLSDDEEKEK